MLGGASFDGSSQNWSISGDGANTSFVKRGIKASNFGKGLVNTLADVGTFGARHISQVLSAPRIYFDYVQFAADDFDGFNKDEYYSKLRTILNENNFNKNVEFENFSYGSRFKSWWNNNTYATVTIRRPSGVSELYQGGHASLYSNSALVLLKPNFTLSDYANVTAHELGHAIFGFGHDTSGKGYVMYYQMQKVHKLKFTKKQQGKIKKSKWGSR